MELGRSSPTLGDVAGDQIDTTWCINQLRMAVQTARARGCTEEMLEEKLSKFVVEIDHLQPPPPAAAVPVNALVSALSTTTTSKPSNPGQSLVASPVKPRPPPVKTDERKSVSLPPLSPSKSTPAIVKSPTVETPNMGAGPMLIGGVRAARGTTSSL